MAGIQTGLVVGVKVPGIEAGFAEADLDGNLGSFGLDDENGEAQFPDGGIRIITTGLAGGLVEDRRREISFSFDRCS